jgi:secreted trypsin-like serine protease
MRIDIATGETQILGIVSMCVKKGCTTVIPAVFARVSKYVAFIKRNLKNFVDPHFDIHKQPDLVCLIAEQVYKYPN